MLAHLPRIVVDGGPAALDGRLRIGDSLVSVRQLSPESWISSHTGSPEPAQTLESAIAALKDASGPWVCEVMRRGCDDVLQVEIACGVRGKNGVSDEQPKDLFGAAAIQKNLWEQLMQATAPKQASWQTKAARVGMPFLHVVDSPTPQLMSCGPLRLLCALSTPTYSRPRLACCG